MVMLRMENNLKEMVIRLHSTKIAKMNLIHQKNLAMFIAATES